MKTLVCIWRELWAGNIKQPKVPASLKECMTLSIDGELPDTFYVDNKLCTKDEFYQMRKDYVVGEAHRKVRSTMKLNWTGQNVVNELTFSQLQVNETFRITPNGEAVYVKVVDHYSGRYFQQELATGKLFKPTSSRVVPVSVEVSVHSRRPMNCPA